jgi:hypothetical protein
VLRWIVIAVGCGLSLLELPVRDAAADRQATFRARTDVVSVNVSVKQSRRPVTNLTAADFALTDNGVEQTVDALALAHVPIDLTLVLTGYNVNRLNSVAYADSLNNASTIRQSLLPSDRLRVVGAKAEIRGRIVRDDEELLLTGDMTDPPDRSVSIIDGLFYALAWPVEADRRHLAVAFTDGVDRWSTLDPDMLPRLAGHSDAVLHVVYWDGPGWAANWEMVSDLVQRTGGAVHRMSDARRDLATIVEDFRTSYVLRYRPRTVPAPGWHEIRVRVTRHGRFDVRARKGYEVRD